MQRNSNRYINNNRGLFFFLCQVRSNLSLGFFPEFAKICYFISAMTSPFLYQTVLYSWLHPIPLHFSWTPPRILLWTARCRRRSPRYVRLGESRRALENPGSTLITTKARQLISGLRARTESYWQTEEWSHHSRILSSWFWGANGMFLRLQHHVDYIFVGCREV